MRLAVLLLACASLLPAYHNRRPDTIDDFWARTGGAVIVKESTFDSPRWLGVCHVLGIELSPKNRRGRRSLIRDDLEVTITCDVGGPISEHFQGVTEAVIKFRDDERKPRGDDPSPEIFIALHDWLGFSLRPYDPNVLATIARFVARNGRGEPTVEYTMDVKVNGRPTADDQPDTHAIEVLITRP